MTDKELRRLNRRGLLEVLVEQSKEIERLESTVAELEGELEQQYAVSRKNGTFADALLHMSGAYEATQKAADRYLEEVAHMKEQTQAEHDGIIEDARQKAELILADAEKVKEKKMKEVREYVRLFNLKVKQFYQTHPEFREYMKKRGSEE